MKPSKFSFQTISSKTQNILYIRNSQFVIHVQFFFFFSFFQFTNVNTVIQNWEIDWCDIISRSNSLDTRTCCIELIPPVTGLTIHQWCQHQEVFWVYKFNRLLLFQSTHYRIDTAYCKNNIPYSGNVGRIIYLCRHACSIPTYHHYIKDSKAEICRGAVGRAWGGNVSCGFVVNHTYQWWWGWAATAAAGLFTCRGSLPATPLRSQIIVTLLKSHCVPW